MNKETQLIWTRTRLLKYGFVTRNQALRSKISRVAARIFDLREEGYDIEGERIPRGDGRWDYKYILK